MAAAQVKTTVKYTRARIPSKSRGTLIPTTEPVTTEDIKRTVNMILKDVGLKN